MLEVSVKHLKEVSKNTMGNLYLKFLLQSTIVRLAETYTMLEKFHMAEALYKESLEIDPNAIDGTYSKYFINFYNVPNSYKCLTVF